MQHSSAKYWLSDIAILLFAFSSLYLGASYFRPIANPDEGRYSEIPREMLATGNYTTPHLNGLPYFYKPPLFYWLQCASFKCFGINRTSIRLMNSLMAIMGVCLTYWAGRLLYGRRAGIFSGVILATSFLYYVVGSVVTLDMSVSVFMSGAMFSFIVAIKKSGIFRSLLFCLFFVFCALAVMTKGIIGILIPCAVVFLFIVLGGKERIKGFFQSLSKRDIYGIVLGMVLFFVICVPWHIAVCLENPATNISTNIFTKNPEGQGFFWYYFIHEHFLRYIDSSTSMRYQPFWFFWVIVPVGFIPWIFLLPRAIKQSSSTLNGNRNVLAFMIIWVVFIVAFFSISSSKLVPYITGVYPALAFIVGTWASKVENLKLKPESIIIIVAGFLASIAIVVAYIVLSKKPIEDEVRIAGFYGAIIFGSLMIVVSSVAVWLYRIEKMKAFWISTLVGVTIFSSAVNINAGMGQKINSEKIALEIQNLASEKPVAIAFNYGAFHDLPVWLNKTLILIGEPPEEQKFGWQRTKAENAHRILSTKQSLENFLRKSDLIVVLRQEDLPKLKAYKIPILMTEIARNKNIIVLEVRLNEK
ncbi:MAG: glycosyltransferase family 39 protein [Verrucomicrobiaceae bacterium]|nr:glycosyltransferase family 39 protein [Verrucomicrobiaceae bacterium]